MKKIIDPATGNEIFVPDYGRKNEAQPDDCPEREKAIAKAKGLDWLGKSNAAHPLVKVGDSVRVKNRGVFGVVTDLLMYHAVVRVYDVGGIPGPEHLAIPLNHLEVIDKAPEKQDRAVAFAKASTIYHRQTDHE